MKIKLMLIILAGLFLYSCGSHQNPAKDLFEKDKSITLNKSDDNMAPTEQVKEMEEKKPKEDFVSGDTSTNLKRKFVRTADMKFQVKDVRKVSYDIEQLTVKYDGFITYSNLNSTVTGRSYKDISRDSILETVFYTFNNEINLRVPNYALDSLILELNKLIDFLDYKIIKADDVSMMIFSNQLNQNRINKYQKRLTDAIDNKGKKLNEIINAEDKLLNKQEQSDYYKTSNMSLYDQVAYSTVKMNIYQREVVKRTVVENFDNIREQKPGFFLRIWDSIKIGWGVVEDITVGLFVIWWLILLLLIGWYILVKSIKRARNKRFQKSQNNAKV
jgi:hypothetical protein